MPTTTSLARTCWGAPCSLPSSTPNSRTWPGSSSSIPARDFYGDWACTLTAAMPRYEAGRDPLNADLTALIGELSTRSPQFRLNWAEQDAHEHRTGRKTFQHPIVGELDATYDVLELPGEQGLSITTYSAVPGRATAQKFTMPAGLAACRELEPNMLDPS